MKGFLLLLDLLGLVGAASAGVTLATPPTKSKGTPLARGTLIGELRMQTMPIRRTGLMWYGRLWQPRALPEFLARLRSRDGVTDFNGWLERHPGAASKIGLTPITVYRSPEIRVGLSTTEPGGTVGWHSHPSPTFVVLRAGELSMYDGKDAGCAPQKLKTGEAFIDPPHHPHTYWNDGPVSAETLTLRIYEPSSGLPERIDQPQAPNCPR